MVITVPDFAFGVKFHELKVSDFGIFSMLLLLVVYLKQEFGEEKMQGKKISLAVLHLGIQRLIP